MRRPNDTRGVVRYMERRTKHQPNYRMFRSLRSIQGLDYLLALRGLKKIEFYDYDLWKGEKKKAQVRDWSFVMDINNSVCRPKAPFDQEIAQVRNLFPLVESCNISEDIWKLLEIVMDGQTPVPPFPDIPDSNLHDGISHNLNLPQGGSIPVATGTIVIEDSSSDDGDDGDISMSDAPSIDLTQDEDTDVV